MMITQQSSKLLHRLDRYLLIHYPRLWALQIHRILYISLLETVISCAILLADYPFGNVVVLGLIIIMLIIVIINLVRMAIRLGMYCIEREFGYFDSFHGFTEIFIYFISAVIIILPLFCSLAFTNYRLSHIITHPELNRIFNIFFGGTDITFIDFCSKYSSYVLKILLGISLPKLDFMVEFLTVIAVIIRLVMELVYHICNFGLLTIMTIISSLFALLMFEKAHAIIPFPKCDSLFFFLSFVILLEFVSIGFLHDAINIPYKITFFFFSLLNGFLLFKIINRNLNRFVETTYLSLVLLPIFLIISVLIFLLLPDGSKMTLQFKLMISSISYLPIIPYLKRQHLKLMSLPRK